MFSKSYLGNSVPTPVLAIAQRSSVLVLENYANILLKEYVASNIDDHKLANTCIDHARGDLTASMLMTSRKEMYGATDRAIYNLDRAALLFHARKSASQTVIDFCDLMGITLEV